MKKFKYRNLSKEDLILTKNALLRYVTFTVLYLAQGITDGITFFVIPAWLAMNDKSAVEIGSFVAVIGIPWSFKVFIAPFIDRYTLLSMGRKRPWVIFGQLGLILSFLSIGFVHDPLNNMFGLMVSGFFISFFGAFQDVATDGMVVDVVPEQEKARANGLMWGSKTVGISLTMLIGTALINLIGFTSAIASLSIVVGMIIMVPICFREREGEKYMPWTRGKISTEAKNVQLKKWSQILRSLFKVIFIPTVIVMIFFSLLYGIIAGFIDTLLPIFTIQELGWTDTLFSRIFSITTLVGGILGIFIGGPLVDFFGDKRMINIYLICIVLIISIFALIPDYWVNETLIFGFIALFYLLSTFLAIGLFAVSMKLCWKVIAATQFTLFMAVANIGRALGSALVGTLESMMSWEYVILSVSLIPLLMILLMRFINFEKNETAIAKIKLV